MKEGHAKKGGGGQRILIVTHETSSTGAPRVAHLVAHSLGDSGHAVQVCARAPGPLLGEFMETCPTFVEPLHRIRRILWRRGPQVIAFLVDTLLAWATLAHRRPDVVYVNSTAAAVYVRPARWLRRRVILHAHESRETSYAFLERARATRTVRRVTVVACSPILQSDLSHLTPGRLPELLQSVPDDRRVLSLAAQRGLDRSHVTRHKLLVGGCGTVEPRKGLDLLAAAAALVHARAPELDVGFVWVGNVPDDRYAETIHGVELLGARSNPYAVMTHFDVAVLPSREDPFPLVVIESMLLGKPVVAFDVGAVAAQVADTGRIVPSGDVPAFAGSLIDLLSNTTERGRLSQAARARALAEFSTRRFVAELNQILEV